MKHSFTTFALALIAISSVAQSNDAQSTLRAKAEQRFNERQLSDNVQASQPKKAGVIVDYLTEQPEGTLKTYLRSGGCFYDDFYYLVETTQDGKTMDMVWSDEGDCVWMKNPVSEEGSGTWLKATIEGNKLHMPLYHAVFYYEDYGYGYMLAKADRTGDTYTVDPTAEEMTYTIHDNGSISLDGTDGGESILALIWTDDFSWTGFGDYESVYTPSALEPVTIPEGLERQSWMYNYYDGSKDVSRVVDMAFDGDKVYVNNILPVFPENAIVGTIQGDKVVFESDQFLGISMGYMMYFDVININGNSITYRPSVEMNYNAEAGTMNAPEGVGFVLNAGPGSEALSYWGTVRNPRFYFYVDEPAVPANPEILKFEESFDEYGYNVVNLKINTVDVEGNQLNPELLKYILWVKIDDEAEEFVFYADEYYSLYADGIDQIVELPYNFIAYAQLGYTEIFPGGETIYLYQYGFDDYGVQSVYYGGGERNVSDIVWLYSTPDGIKQLTEEQPSADLYDLNGRKLNKLQSGVNIRVNADGSTSKVIVK